MIKRLLKSIRQKPKSSRDNIAFSIASLFSGLILIAWLYNAPVRHMAIEERYRETEAESSKASFSSFFGNLTDQMASLKDSVSSEGQLLLKDTVNNEITPLQIEPVIVEGRASTSDMYTWPTETDGFEESTSNQPSAVTPAETAREVRIITTGKSTTTAN